MYRRSRLWWHIPVSPALCRLRQEDHELEVSLGFTARLNQNKQTRIAEKNLGLQGVGSGLCQPEMEERKGRGREGGGGETPFSIPLFLEQQTVPLHKQWLLVLLSKELVCHYARPRGRSSLPYYNRVGAQTVVQGGPILAQIYPRPRFHPLRQEEASKEKNEDLEPGSQPP